MQPIRVINRAVQDRCNLNHHTPTLFLQDVTRAFVVVNHPMFFSGDSRV